MLPQGLALSIIARFEHAERIRGTWEAHWEEVARRVIPRYSHSFNQGMTLPTPGAKRNEELYDATASLALPKFAAAMESMLTPRNSRWHGLRPLDSVLRRNRSARLYFEQTTDALFRYRYAPRAGYASQQYEVYLALGAFGTGSMFVDQLDKRYGGGLRYRALHLSEIYFLTSHQGIIDTAMRKFPLTARQAMQRYPEGLPQEIQDAAHNDKNTDKEFWFLHCVKPREEAEGFDPERLDVKGMPYAAITVSMTGQAVIKEGGFRVFPYPISRYVLGPGETYGRSPAMMALPAIKTLNEEKKTMLKQGHRVVDPMLLVHDDGVLDDLSGRPGTVVSGGVSAEGRLLVHPLPTGNLAVGKDMMQDERAVINDAFLVSLFQILVETPQMTATEVLERAREKGALLSPTMGRQQSEFLGPLIERELDVLSQQNLLPPMPAIVQEALGEFEIVYESPLSRAQRAEQATGLLQIVNWMREGIAVTGDSSPMDWIDWDTAVPELADISAVPTRWIRDSDQVAQIRQARAQQAQAQQMIDAAPAAAGIVKAVSGNASRGNA